MIRRLFAFFCCVILSLQAFGGSQTGLDLKVKVVADKTELKRQGDVIIIGKAYKDKLLKSDLTKELNAFQIKIAQGHGGPFGIQITSIKEHSLLLKAGFKEGDVIKTVNGKSVVSPRNLLKIFGFMNSKGSVPSGG